MFFSKIQPAIFGKFCTARLIMSAPVISALNDSFLPEKLVMIDCEMTGVRPKEDDLLQVAMVKLEKSNLNYTPVGEPLVLYLHTNKEPETGFQQKYLTEIFKKCKESSLTAKEASEKIKTWLGDWIGLATPVGDCVIADLRFLYENDLIKDSFYKNDEPVPGTFHYEIFDMNSIKACARVLWGEKKKPQGLDEENVHDALVDCNNQILELNHILDALLNNGSGEIKSHLYSQGMQHYVEASLPADLAPTIEIVDLPEHVSEESLLIRYGELMVAAKNFEEMQGLMNKILLEEGITEQYRSSVAGIVNQFRLHNNLTLL